MIIAFSSFITLLLYCFDSKKQNGCRKFTDSSQKLILSLLYQLKYVNTHFDNLKIMILIWKTKNF